MHMPQTPEQKTWWAYGVADEAEARKIHSHELRKLADFVEAYDQGIQKGQWTEAQGLDAVHTVFFPHRASSDVAFVRAFVAVLLIGAALERFVWPWAGTATLIVGSVMMLVWTWNKGRER